MYISPWILSNFFNIFYEGFEFLYNLDHLFVNLFRKKDSSDIYISQPYWIELLYKVEQFCGTDKLIVSKYEQRDGIRDFTDLGERCWHWSFLYEMIAVQLPQNFISDGSQCYR